MAKHNISAILTIFALLLSSTQIKANEEDEVKLEYRCLKNQKLTKIHYFVQDYLGGPNATVFPVARAAVSTDDVFSFGHVLVADDVITAAPEADSEVLGRSQGTVISIDMKETVMAMDFNVVFTAGKFNGSTLSFQGRNPINDRRRPMAVVGGTGVFRYTRGHAVASTYSFQVGANSSVYAVLEYNVYATYC